MAEGCCELEGCDNDVPRDHYGSVIGKYCCNAHKQAAYRARLRAGHVTPLAVRLEQSRRDRLRAEAAALRIQADEEKRRAADALAREATLRRRATELDLEAVQVRIPGTERPNRRRSREAAPQPASPPWMRAFSAELRAERDELLETFEELAPRRQGAV